ncbi:MAG: hypothetical protein ACI4VB_08870 [Bradymonadia bacterium]
MSGLNLGWFWGAGICLACAGMLGCGETECKMGERICEKNVSKTCIDGLWVSVVCENAAPVCDEIRGCVGIQATCGNGILESAESCDMSQLGGKTCDDVFPGLVGTLSCSSDCTLDTSGCRVPECEENAAECRENAVWRCTGGVWVAARTCQGTEKCDAATGTCKPSVCRDGERRCTAQTLELCVDDVWHTVVDCAESGLKCDPVAAACVQETCVEGAQMCVEDESGKNHAVAECVRNAWQATACEPGQTCTLDVESGDYRCAPKVCEEGISCDGDRLVTCRYNLITSSVNCASLGQTCSVEEKRCLD